MVDEVIDMKKATYKKVDEKIVKQIVHHEESVDENGNVIPAWDEEVEKVIPIMGVVYEEMTEEEIASLPQEEVYHEPTLEERLAAMENAMLEMILGGM